MRALTFTVYFIAAFYTVAAGRVIVSYPELQDAIRTVSAGDTIFILPGDYKNIPITLKEYTFSEPIVIRPLYYGMSVLSGSSSLRLVKCSNIKIEGFLVKDSHGATIIINSSTRIQIYNNYFIDCGSNPNHCVIRIVNGSHDNTVSYNTFDNLRSQGILIATYANNPQDEFNTKNVIYRNYFCNVRPLTQVYPKLKRNGMECLMIGFGSDVTSNYNLETSVTQNLFENIIGDGNETISNKTSNNAYVENTFLRSASGVSIRSGERVKVVGNYFNEVRRAIRIFGFGHYIGSNLIVNGDIAFNLPSGDFLKGQNQTYVGYFQPDSITIVDNVIINPSDAAFLIGNQNRKEMPVRLFMQANTIFISENSEIYKGNRKASIGILDKNEIRKDISKDKMDVVERSFTQLDRIVFTSNDFRVGCMWKRPFINGY